MACHRRCAHRSCSSGANEEESRDVAVLRAVWQEKQVLPWDDLVGKLLRIRARQRYWGLLGQLLQQYPASLRDRLRLVWR